MDTCTIVRDSLSARADGEEGVLPVADCDAHVATCVGCGAFSASLPSLVRSSRVAAAVDVPDLTAQILEAAAREDVEGESIRREQLRWTLGLVGLAQALLAMVAMAGDASHVSRDLATWQLALGVGFIVAAWQPHRAKGLLPMVGVLGLAAVVSSVSNLVSGATTFGAELSHVVEVAGVGLVWGVARLSEDPRSSTLAVSR